MFFYKGNQISHKGEGTFCHISTSKIHIIFSLNALANLFIPRPLHNMFGMKNNKIYSNLGQKMALGQYFYT
jgi:hypothetical protein